MKMLVERAPLSENLPFDLDNIKTHVRVDGGEDDNALGIIGQTAAAEIEQFAQIALLSQVVNLTIFDPDFSTGLHLPIGPVLAVNTPTISIDGEAFTAFDFVAGIRPYLHWSGGHTGHTATRMSIEYMAGFGESQADIPHDLAQAIMDQAALHYDGRSPMSARELTTSPHMARIGARYRGVIV
ncbi:MAG: head-tail connector protein [Marinosulfonomonas sp.]